MAPGGGRGRRQAAGPRVRRQAVWPIVDVPDRAGARLERLGQGG